MDAYQVDADALFSSDESDHGHDSNASDRASNGTTTTRAEAMPMAAPAKRQRVSNDYSEGRSLGGLRLSSLGRFSGAVENLRRAEPTRRPTVEGAHIYNNNNNNNNNSRNNNSNRFNRGRGFGGGMGGVGGGPRGNYGGHFRGGGRGRGRGNGGSGGGGGGGMRDSYVASGYGGGPGRGRGRPLPAHMTRGRGINGDAPRPAPPPKLSAAEKAASIIPEGERQRVIGALEANRAANANSAPRRRPGRRMPARRADNASGNSSGGDVSSASANANAAVNVNNSLGGKRRGLTEMLASVRDVDDLIKLDPDRGRRGQVSVGAGGSMGSSSRGPPKSDDDRRKARRSVDLRDVYANAAISKEARMKEAAKQEAERRAIREKFEVERRREREERRAFAHRLRKLPTVSESMRVATKMAKAERDLFWDADKSERDQLGLTGIHLREFPELHPRTEELLAVEIVHI